MQCLGESWAGHYLADFSNELDYYGHERADLHGIVAAEPSAVLVHVTIGIDSHRHDTVTLFYSNAATRHISRAVTCTPYAVSPRGKHRRARTRFVRGKMLCAILIAVGVTEQERERACDVLCPQVSHECAADVTCTTCKGNDCRGPAQPACCEHVGYGDGDCNEDSHCIGDLVCGKNNWSAATANSPPRRPWSHPLLPVLVQRPVPRFGFVDDGLS